MEDYGKPMDQLMSSETSSYTSSMTSDSWRNQSMTYTSDSSSFEYSSTEEEEKVEKPFKLPKMDFKKVK